MFAAGFIATAVVLIVVGLVNWWTARDTYDDEELDPAMNYDRARLGYEAYARRTGGKTFDGRDMPTWVQLPQHIQDAWADAAAEIVHDVLCDCCKNCESCDACGGCQ
jgi:hypothetical protein